jgi:AcrR family transcriptional regulator
VQSQGGAAWCLGARRIISKEPKDDIVTNVVASESARQAILQGALEEFAARGFDGATNRGIAERAGLTHGLVRYYFKSKEKLWYEAVDYLFERSAAEHGVTPELVMRVSVGDRLAIREWIKAAVRYSAKYPEHARIIYQESIVDSERLKYVTDRYSRSGHLLTLAIIERAIELGVLPATVTPISVFYVIVSSTQNFFSLAAEIKLSMGYDVFSQEAIEAHATTVADLICPLPAGVQEPEQGANVSA